MSENTPPSQNQAPAAPPPPPYGQYAPTPPYAQTPGGYPATPGYAPQPYGGYAAPAKTNVLAVVSLVSSLVGITLVPFVGSIVGIITGHMSLGQLRSSGEQGRGLALSGTIIGYVGLAFSIFGIIAMIAWASWFLPYMDQIAG